MMEHIERRFALLLSALVVISCDEKTDTPPPPSATEEQVSSVSSARSAPSESGGDRDGDGGVEAHPDSGATASPGSPSLPPQNAGLDYQLGGGYAPPNGVGIVSRDRTDAPEPGLYNVCYVNGFQVQPGEEADWEPDLLLRDASGEVVIDEDWDEALLDIGTADKRERIAEVVGDWIRGCKTDGFDAIEIDNLDTFTRSGDLVSEDDAVQFMALLSEAAHTAGLAIAQKNAVELVPRRAEMGTDFVVAEECNAWGECDGYIESYGAHVLMIEYAVEDFRIGCDRYGSEFSVVLRDRNLTTPESRAYVYDGC